MRREQATKYARELLDQNGLTDWKVHIFTNITKPYVGLCSYKDKSILLNAHHLDIHPDFEIEDTIKHEVAHALCPNDGHGEKWKEIARQLNCSTSPTCALSLDPYLIDAIRSGHIVESEVTEHTEIVKEVKYKITKLQDKCPVCGKVAKEKSSFEHGEKKFITYECGHLIVRSLPKATPFESLVFDGKADCKHNWSLPVANEYKTICSICNAKRPYKFQVEGMKTLERYNGRFGIFDEQGLGKTIQSLGYLKFHPEATPFIWICKSGLKFQAMKEIMRILGWDYIPQVIEKGNEHIFPNFKAYIVSYDILRRMSRDKIEQLKKIVKTAVIDEVQHIKNPDSTRTQEVRNLVREMEHIIPLSGTHWKNRGSESFIACNLINPAKFNSFDGFKKRWVKYYWDGNKLKEGGLEQGFREYCSDIFIRRERVEVMKELPLINRTKLYCSLPKETMEAYDDAVDDFVKIWNNLTISGEEESFAAAGQVLAELKKMRQLIGIAKIPATVEFAQEFLENTDRKLVIFVHHIAAGQEIYRQMEEFCKENNISIFKLSSDMSPELRFKMCEDFNKAKQCILVASTLASGEGLNLQTCSDCIMHERQWNPANEEQAEGRFIRIGQQATSVTATYVEAEGTVDADLDGIVSRKRVQFHESMNKGEMPQWNQNSIIKELGDALANRWRNKNRK